MSKNTNVGLGETIDDTKIKIFVSHRIDQDSKTIDNEIYVPVRCGAIYDERQDIDILGDNTGDNISEKRMSFCELTVLYWAWKNQTADYYGLCHYRRYISFTDEKFTKKDNHSGILFEEELNDKTIEKFELNNIIKITEDIKSYDIITTPAEDVHYSGDNKHKSVYDLCLYRKRDFDLQGIDALLELIKIKYPKYVESAENYFSDHYAKFYNCFIMEKNIFNEFCSFLFDILFEIEKKLDTRYYNKWKTRMPGFLSEHLLGIFLDYYKKQENIKIGTKELVYFQETKKKDNSTISPAFNKNNVPIVFSCSDYFAPFASVLIKSIIDNSVDNKNYDIVIFESAISKQNKILLEEMVKDKKNVSVRFFNPKPLLKGAELFINSPNQSEEAYYRVLAPFILADYKKAIVMDCDLVAKCDISELIDIELDNNVAGIVPDVVWHGWANGLSKELDKYIEDKFHIKNIFSYCNTGVILFDMEKYRELFEIEYIVEYIQKNQFNIQEQDALNLLLEDKIKFLDISWNMYVLSTDFIKFSIDDFAPIEEVKQYYRAHESPKLIHYAAYPKPWTNPDVDLGIEWWDIARKTPFYEIILTRLIDAKIAAFWNFRGLDNRSGARKLADKFLPSGSHRREFAKFLIPRDSIRWKLCKKIYFIFKPQYRNVEN